MRKYEIDGAEFSADDIINPDDREFCSRVFIVSEACGNFGIIRGIVFADSADTALDEIADAGKLSPIESEDFADYGIETDEPRCAFLGNDGKPFDLDNVGIHEIDADGLSDALAELDSRKTYEIGSEFGRTHLPVTVSETPVYCPKTMSAGFGRAYAEPGFYLALEPEKYSGSIARVLGRIESPSDVNGYILAIVLASNGRHCFERWIDPSDVRECYAESPSALWQFFTGEMPNPRTVIALASHGTLSENYAKSIPERITELEARMAENL